MAGLLNVKDRQKALQVVLDLNLDGRTLAAQYLKTLQEAFEDSPQDASKAILHRSLAVTSLLETALASQVISDGKPLVDEGGELLPAVKELLKVQQATCRLLGMLPTVDDARRRPKAKETTVADLILAEGD